MNKKALSEILQCFKNAQLSKNKTIEKLKNLAFENIGYAHIDHNRSLRKKIPEIIFGERKTAEQIIGIIEKLLNENVIIVSRIKEIKAKKVLKKFPNAKYHNEAKILILENKKEKSLKTNKKVLILSAGTSDMSVAKECEITANALGLKTELIVDVGVAGLHRLLYYKNKIEKAKVIIVIAGMEGTLPSVVAGLTFAPVIAVPTSVGYGTNFKGVSTLFTMLNSCSSNIAVVNIDNGFGAAYFAASILLN